MAEKHIDLIHAIEDTDSMTGCERTTVEAVLGWLDRNPDRVPGLTITQSEYRDTLNHAVKTSGYGDDWERGFCTGLTVGGTKVIPDPEPTNAEKLAIYLGLHDLDAITQDGVAEFAQQLDADGVKAPGVDEPESAELDRDWWVENANVNDAENCEACEGDLCPVHYGISVGIDLMAKKIAALGNDPELFALIPDPVKAPGVDDD